MTETASQFEMPSTLRLVTDAVESYRTDKSKSSVLEFDKQTLIDIGLILIDERRDDLDAFKFISDEYPDSEIRKSPFYRFAADFKCRFESIVQGYREKIANLWIDQATAGHADGMAELLKTHLMKLMAQKVIGTRELANLQGRELGAIIAMLDGWSRAKFKREEVDLKTAEGERKAQKLEADLAMAQLERQQLEAKLASQQKQFRETSERAVAGAEEAAKSGGGADAVIKRVRDLLGLPA